MNQKTAYEITITDKLEQLSVPDMVDAIWAKIETQLDIDLPTDDGPANPPSNPPIGSGSWKSVGILIVVAAIVVSIFIVNKKNRVSGESLPDSGNSPVIISPEDNKNNLNTRVSEKKTIPGINTPVDNSTKLPGSFILDSLNNAGTVLNPDPLPDSVYNNKGSDNRTVGSPLPIVAASDTTKNKGRGVKGISDDDYKITPVKKDSTKG